MGYRSDFQLFFEPTIVPIDQVKFEDALREITHYGWESNSSRNWSLYDVKWYEKDTDLAKLSAFYPDAKITVEATGEDGDRDATYAFGGRVEVCGADLVFDSHALWPVSQDDNLIWIVSYSYDWEDAFATFRNLSSLEAWIRENFDLSPDLPAWSREFWSAHVDAYNAADWKSFQVLEISRYDGKVRAFTAPRAITGDAS